MATVLIVEDDPIIALDLSQSIVEGTGAQVTVAGTVSAAQSAVSSGVDFALLDVNIGKGTTYALARCLSSDGIPFVFTSGSSNADMPDDLRSARFLSKPCRAADIIKTVRNAIEGSWRRQG